MKIGRAGDIYVNKQQMSPAEFATECARLKKVGGAIVLFVDAPDHVASPSQAEVMGTIVKAGVAMATTTEEVDLVPLPRARPMAARCTAIQVCAIDADGVPLDSIVPGSTVQVTVNVESTRAVLRALLGVEVMDERGRPALGVSTDSIDAWFDLEAPAVDVGCPVKEGTHFGILARNGDTRGAANPTWSHDGTTIVYSSTTAGQDGRLATGPSDLTLPDALSVGW